MKPGNFVAVAIAIVLTCMGAASAPAQRTTGAQRAIVRPEGPCDVYAAAGDPCVAAHSTTRALYRGYNGPLYQVLRQSDGKKLNVGVMPSSKQDAGGYADAAAQDVFCANTYCWMSIVYDQSPRHNDLTQAPRGGFSGPSLGGFNNLPLAGMAPVTVMGHRVYGVFITPGSGLRNDDPRGTAVDDQAEGQYWVINGHHFNSGCCFDYGNSEIDSRDDDNGTMETTYYGDTTPWYHGNLPGPWVMTDQENNLVGCVNDDGSKLCANLPSIKYRFVTAMAKGEPHHWTSMGGDAQRGPLTVMFDGRRIDSSYDPMRKQGAILLGNGGDNSNGSQGTFYEGAMTASGTFPTDATDQRIQANVVAASYAVATLSVMPAPGVSIGSQVFSSTAPQDTVVTFTNTTAAPISGLAVSLAGPGKDWAAVVQNTQSAQKTFAEAIAPGSSVSTTFRVTAGATRMSGDLVGRAVWTDAATKSRHTESASESVRTVLPVKINEFRLGAESGGNASDAFVELYNAGSAEVDLSNWTMTVHPTQQAIASAVKVPAGTRLAARQFYVFGLANSGLAAATRSGDTVLHVRSIAGMAAGDTVQIGSGTSAESRRIVSLGTAATNHTSLWQPLPDGPITLAAGSTNVPVESVAGFVIGQKIALGHGATYPAVARETEQFEVVTVTAVGKPGTQAYLAAEARAGSTHLQVTSVENLSVGDRIRLDIDSPGHGIETVTVTQVGTRAEQTNLSADAPAGATEIRVRRPLDLVKGSVLTVGTPASLEQVTVTEVGAAGPNGVAIHFKPALARKHGRDEWVVLPGTGVAIASPLRFTHAANLPFSNRGTGITFQPATKYIHASNEPVQALGTGITLDKALTGSYDLNTAVYDATVTTAGYQGKPVPNQWFGGPALTTESLQFGRTLSVREGSLVLRDADGQVMDAVNYGGLVDPWAAAGDQSVSGTEHHGCFAPAPRSVAGSGVSVGRVGDGVDTGSHCNDFVAEPSTALALDAAAGATALKVGSIAGFHVGQSIRVAGKAGEETATIQQVGSAGATLTTAAVSAGATVISVAGVNGFTVGQTVTVGTGADAETAVIAAVSRRGTGSVTFTKALAASHPSDEAVSGSGLMLASGLRLRHERESAVSGNAATPGAPNHFSSLASATK